MKVKEFSFYVFNILIRKLSVQTFKERTHLSSILLHVCYTGIPPLFLFRKVTFCCVFFPLILIEVLMIEAVVCCADCGLVNLICI